MLEPSWSGCWLRVIQEIITLLHGDLLIFLHYGGNQIYLFEFFIFSNNMS